MLLALGIAAGIIYRDGPAPLTFIYEHWIGLQTAAILMSVVQAIYCYASSFRPGALLALGGNSGNFIYDVRFTPPVLSLQTMLTVCIVVHWPRAQPLHRLLRAQVVQRASPWSHSVVHH